MNVDKGKNMKIIHCADLHLDSPMNTHFSGTKAKERKNELLETFRRMIGYAVDNDVAAIIIAGDMFDKKNISATARNTVMYEITNNPQIDFYYLKGNHDADNFVASMDLIPANLKLFGQEWTKYIAYEENGNRIVITGIEQDDSNYLGIYSGLTLEDSDFNIVVLHGQEAVASGNKPENININNLKNRSIDYLALGHVHFYKEAPLDVRGVYCYPGCLEGRGFDECGEHGFVLMDIDVVNRTFTKEFVNIATRSLYELEVDVSGCNTTMEISKRISQVIEACCYGRENMVKILLTGKTDVECEKDLNFLTKQFENEFYFVKIQDDTVFEIDYEEYAYDESLKGEFIRLVKSKTDLSEEDKAMIIRFGIQALKGEGIRG